MSTTTASPKHQLGRPSSLRSTSLSSSSSLSTTNRTHSSSTSSLPATTTKSTTTTTTTTTLLQPRTKYSSSLSTSSSSSNNTPPSFHERKAFPHLASFNKGRANHSGPNGAPVVRTEHGSLVFPAKRSGATTWLKQYRKNNSTMLHGATIQQPTTTRFGTKTKALNVKRFRKARKSREKMYKRPFVHEFEPNLLASALSEVTVMTNFRHDVLFKPQRANHLRSTIKVQELAKRKREELLDAQLAAAPNIEDLSDFELLKVTLRDIRQHVEKLKVSGALDLRAFLGANLEVVEFARLFRTQIGVKLEGRKLGVVMDHFDKDKDGTLDYIEVHSQLMNPHRLHVSNEEASKEDMLQTALNKVRDKVLEKQKAKITKGTAKEEDLINKTTGGKKGRGPDLKSIFSHFDTDNSGVITREEFVESLIKLGVEMNRYEINELYWTLDPDRSGKLSYAEFSRMFFDRRTRLNKEKKRNKKKLLKPHWTPTSSLEAREEISKDRKGMYTGIGTPYKLEEHVAWELDQERRRNVKYGLWKSDQGGFHAKLLVNNKAFLNAPAVEAIQLENEYIHKRAHEASKTFLQRHDRNVQRHSKRLHEKSLLPPEVTIPKFGRWNKDQSVPIVLDDSVLSGLGGEGGENNDGPNGEDKWENESDADSMQGFRISVDDWDMNDIEQIIAKARE